MTNDGISGVTAKNWGAKSIWNRTAFIHRERDVDDEVEIVVDNQTSVQCFAIRIHA